MTNRIDIDVEGRWQDGFDDGDWENLFYLDDDPVRQVLTTHGVLDDQAHNLITKHDRIIFRIGVMPVVDETDQNRSLLRVLFSYSRGNQDQADDFLVEPEPAALDPDQPAPFAKVWQLHTDSADEPFGAVPTPIYVRETNAALIATTDIHEGRFEELMRSPVKANAVQAFLGFEACFASPIDRHDVPRGGIQVMSAENLRS